MNVKAASDRQELIDALNGRPTDCSFCGKTAGEENVLAVRVAQEDDGLADVLCICDACTSVVQQVFEVYEEAKRDQFMNVILPQLEAEMPPHVREALGLNRPQQHVSIDGPVI